MYTIKIRSGITVPHLISFLEERIARSRFTAVFVPINADTIHVKPVRLRKAKPYCGQHPGGCKVGPRRKARWLEWSDWVEFHGLVNAVCDLCNVSADIWTNPSERMDKGRKMWVRRGTRRRINWDYEQVFNGFRNVATWNHGTDDQFIGVTDAVSQRRG